VFVFGSPRGSQLSLVRSFSCGRGLGQGEEHDVVASVEQSQVGKFRTRQQKLATDLPQRIQPHELGQLA
jgi:hypothetical protein